MGRGRLPSGAVGDGLVLFVASAAGERRHRVLFDGGVERGGEDLVGLCVVSSGGVSGEGGGDGQRRRLRSEVVVVVVVVGEAAAVVT